MEFIKKHWKKILILAIIAFAIWYFTMRKKETTPVVAAPATPATPGSTSTNPTPAT